MREDIPRLRIRTGCADNHDKLGWEAGFVLKTDSGSLGIRTNEPSLLPTLRGSFDPDLLDTSESEVDYLVSFLYGTPSNRKGTRNLHVVYCGCSNVARSLDFEEALWEYRLAVRKILYPDERESVYLKGVVYRDPVSKKAVLFVGESREQVRADPTATSENLFESSVVRVDAQARIWPGDQRTLGFLQPGRIRLCDDRASEKQTSPGELLMILLTQQWGINFDPRISIPILKRLIEESELIE
jgi:hypothetical protein